MSVKIRARSGILYLDIHYGKSRRVKKSLGQKDTLKNRKLIEKNIIPIIEEEISRGLFDPNFKEKKVLLLEEYGMLYFERHRNERRPHVTKKDIQHFKKHIVPTFGKRRLDNIKSMELLDWQNEKLKDYKNSTVKKFRSIFNQILEDALIEELLEKNPFIHVRKPKNTQRFTDNKYDTSVNPFSLEEVFDLIDNANGYIKNFIAIMAFTGARPGELVALNWNDIDFENELISISKTRLNGADGLPKTKASMRDIEMLPIVKEYLEKQYLITGNNSNQQVFCNSSRNLLFSHDIVATQFKKLLKNDDERYLYQLRHTFASLMISKGEDIMWVSQMMGHENIDMTLGTYTHFYKLNEQKSKRKERATFLKNVPNSSHLLNEVA